MKTIYTLVFTILISAGSFGQKVVFLHHSVGGNVFNEGNVYNWFTNYNTANNTNYEITELAYPDNPYEWANYPYDYWNLWINHTCNNNNDNIMCMDKLTQNYNVIIFKHCYPGAEIEANETTASVSSPTKTLENYKLQYRALRTLMDGYPNNKFIVWTLTPEHRLETTAEKAARAKEFVNWVKTSWLSEDSKSHPNIYIFDFWSLVAETSTNPTNGKTNCLKYAYEQSHSNAESHPNLTANQYVGPLFAQTIVNVLKSTSSVSEKKISNFQINYSNQTLHISGLTDMDYPAKIEVFTTSGKTILNKTISDSYENIALRPGSYVVSITGSNSHTLNQKLVLTK